ncbi:hypothetical protein [Sulfuriflexus mobilis]|uniref:hypothetical protein n=1 Tax=Sulfuriflexus mobilis TaxID=1811807 RepID=UPI000F8383C2|nr:hypothetical protein [Sulfuriflexus mobilis]
MSQEDWSVLGFFAIIGLLLASHRVRQMARNKPNEILNNVFFTFILSFSAFFLFGPLLHVFGHPEEIEYSRSFFSITADKAVTVLGANLLGFGVSLMIGGYLHFGPFVNFAIKNFSRLPAINIRRASVWLVVVGFAFKAYVLYNDLFVNEVISGLYRSAQLLLPVGVFLHFKENLLALRLRSIFFLCAMLLYAAGGLLEFNKTETFIPLLAMVGGILVRKMTLTRLVLSVAGMGFALTILQPIYGDARVEAWSRSKTSLEERISIFQSAYRNEFRIDELENIGIWSRFDYTSPDAAAMWLYENGNGGDSYQMIPWLFVPRLLYSDKPITTTAGINFTDKVLGYNTSSTGQGIFISGYYDLGWFGLIGASALAGFILAWYRALILAAQISQSTTLLIMGLLGHWTAFSVSGDYLATYLGTFVISLYAFVLIMIMLGLQSSHRVRV